jgi:hypothetical protein
MPRKRTLKQEALRSIDAELRAELMKRRKAIDVYLRALKQKRKAALAKASHDCQNSKERARARSKAIRAKASEEARQVIEAAKGSCARGRARAKRIGQRESASLGAERKQSLADQRALQGAGKKLREKDRRKPKAGERSDEVAANLPADLVPVWKAVKQQFRENPRKSLTEQFLEWVEANPDEVFALQDPVHERLVKEAEAEQKALMRTLRSRKKLQADDWERIGATREELEAVGLNPDEPEDVLAFVSGYSKHWEDRAAGVPF